MTDDKKETSTHLSEPTYQSTTQTSNEHHQTSGPSAPVYVENATGLNDIGIILNNQPQNQQQQQQPQLQQQQQQQPPPPYYAELPQLHPYPPPPITTTVLQPPYFMTPSVAVGSSPSRLRCPNCQADVVTQTIHKSGCMTWTLCGSICALGLFAPCAWFGCQFIPFCIDSCKDVQHNCPNCRAYIATFDRIR